MSRTSELTKLPGVAAAGLFSRKGFLEEFEGTMTVAEATEMANLCSDITMNIELQGRLLGRLADQAGWDGRGWITFGPDMAVVAIGDSACMVKSGQTSFNQVVQAMAASAGG
jgi:roadblock/LC7 domain-containing protein